MPLPFAKQRNILWDLGNTLISFRQKAAAQDHDDKRILSFLACFYGDKKTLSHLECKALSILEETGKQLSTPEMLILLPSGHPAPEIICSWYAGKITQEQAIHKVTAALEKNNLIISSHEEKITLQNMLIAVFNPILLGEHLFPIAQGLELLEQCAHNRQNKLFVLSNIDPYSFTYFYTTLPGKLLFRYFDQKNICISGQVGAIKPHREIYDYFLSTYKLEPKSCIFIDNQPENFYWPRQFGISCVELKENDYNQLKTDLASFKIL
jgi:FMN phosphatase YigB (HAD superfamily)